MRIVPAFVIILLGILVSRGQADIAHSYSGFGGEISWTPNIAITPLARIVGSLDPTPIDQPNFTVSKLTTHTPNVACQF